MPEDESLEYKLAAETSEKKYQEQYVKPVEPSESYLEEPPKKVKQIDLLAFIRIPFSFAALVLAFWLALNLSSIIQSGNPTQWMQNWAENTQVSFREYFDNGQIATYEGAITGSNDYAGETASGDVITILESSDIPFTEDGTMPISIRRLLDAYDAKRCDILAHDLAVYTSLSSADSDLQNYYDVVATRSNSLSNMLNCK